jgi:hypothetical protein
MYNLKNIHPNLVKQILLDSVKHELSGKISEPRVPVLFLKILN